LDLFPDNICYCVCVLSRFALPCNFCHTCGVLLLELLAVASSTQLATIRRYGGGAGKPSSTPGVGFRRIELLGLCHLLRGSWFGRCALLGSTSRTGSKSQFSISLLHAYPRKLWEFLSLPRTAPREINQTVSKSADSCVDSNLWDEGLEWG